MDQDLRDREGWDAFASTVTPKQANTTAWLAGVRERLEVQTTARASLPEHYTTAGAEAAAASLKSMLEQRSFSLRNKDRTNRFLGLMRLHLAGRRPRALPPHLESTRRDLRRTRRAPGAQPRPPGRAASLR